jgi:hypothetical protein
MMRKYLGRQPLGSIEDRVMKSESNNGKMNHWRDIKIALSQNPLSCHVISTSLLLHVDMNIYKAQSQTVRRVNSKGFWRRCMTQNCWVIGLFPSSRILENRKHDVSETGSVSVLRWRGENTRTQLGPLERADLNVQWFRLGLSKGPNWVGVFSPLTWGRNHIEFPKRRVFYSLEYRTMENVQNPRNSEWEEFRRNYRGL